MTPFPKPSLAGLMAVLGLTIIFSYLITWITVSGLLWSLLPESFKSYPRHAVQAFLLSDASDQPAPIFLGDKLFLETAGKRSTGHFIEIKAIDPDDMEDAVKAILRRYRRPTEEMASCPLVLQLSPYFTLRMNFRGEKLNYDYFNIQNRKLNWFLPNRATKLFWDTFRDLARTTGRDIPASDVRDRPETFPVQLSIPDPNLENWQRVSRRIERAKIPVWLVPDEAGSDYTSAPAVLSYFSNGFMEELVTGRFANENVQIVPFDELSQALQNQCDPAERA